MVQPGHSRSACAQCDEWALCKPLKVFHLHRSLCRDAHVGPKQVPRIPGVFLHCVPTEFLHHASAGGQSGVRGGLPREGRGLRQGTPLLYSTQQGICTSSTPDNHIRPRGHSQMCLRTPYPAWHRHAISCGTQRGPTNIGADFGARAVRTAFIRARFLRFFFVEVLGRSSGSSCRGEIRRIAAVVRKRAKFRNEPPIAIGSAHLRFHGGGREDTHRAAPYTCHWGACRHTRKGRGIMVLLAWLLRIIGTLIRHDVVRVIPTLHRK